MLTIFVAFYLAGGQGLGGLSFGDALIYVRFRMLAITLILSPLFLAAFTIWLGYRFLIKKKLKTVTNQVLQPGIPPDG